MESISIEVSPSTDNDIEYLIDALNKLNECNFKIKSTVTNQTDSGGTIICFFFKDGLMQSLVNKEMVALRNHAAKVIADYIIKFYEEKLLMRTINSSFCFFKPYEKKQIFDMCLSYLKSIDEDSFFDQDITNRRQIIFDKISEYLESNNEINIDGFINFRIKEYLNILEDAIEKTSDTFLMEREYQEFIKLLRYFVEIQIPKLEAVHIISIGQRYIILDDKHKEITDECIQDFLIEKPEKDEINFDDLLVSTLITLAPIRIYIHLSNQIKNKELIETIKNVFVNKVIFCNGCDLCKSALMNIEHLTF